MSLIGSRKRYNVKEFVFPDGTVQRRIYQFPIYFETGQSPGAGTGLTVEQKELENMSRARQEIFRIARSNHWDWMVTFTFSEEFCDRSSYDDVTRLLYRFTDLLRKRGCKWLIIPEFHSDMKSFHFHGLIQGELPVVRAIHPDFNLPMYYVRPQTGEVVEVYNIKNWKYGYCTATRVDSSQRASNYITKYITKQTYSVVPKGRKRYWASRSLLRPKERRLYVAANNTETLIPADVDFVKTYTDFSGNEIILVEFKPEVK